MDSSKADDLQYFQKSNSSGNDSQAAVIHNPQPALVGKRINTSSNQPIKIEILPYKDENINDTQSDKTVLMNDPNMSVIVDAFQNNDYPAIEAILQEMVESGAELTIDQERAVLYLSIKKLDQNLFCDCVNTLSNIDSDCSIIDITINGNKLPHLAASNNFYRFIEVGKNLGFAYNEKNDYNETPLYSAIRHGKLEFVKNYIEKYGKAIRNEIIQIKTRINGCERILSINPLGYAVLCDDSDRPEIREIAKFLLDKDEGETINKLSAIFELVIELNRHMMLTIILQHNKIIAAHKSGSSYLAEAFGYAAYLSRIDILKIIAYHFPDVVQNANNLQLPHNIEQNASNLPLYRAICSKNEYNEISNTVLCLVKLGAKISQRDASGHDALWYAEKELKKAIKQGDKQQESKYKRITNLLNNYIQSTEEELFKLLHCKVENVEALVFSGGGPKGTAYIGVLNKLKQLMQEVKDKNKDVADFKKIRRVAGTSAGAIVAGLLAVGYTPEELEKELKNLPMVDFIDNNLIKSLIEGKSNNQSNFQQFKSLLVGYYNGTIKGNEFTGTIKGMFKGHHGLCTGDRFLDWIENKIREKIQAITGNEKITHLTFGELHKFKQEYPTKLKDLYVVATNLSENEPEIREFNSEDGKSDTNIISYAIRASMSIPGLFSIAQEAIKQNGRLKLLANTYYIDGGLLRNYPINIFDTSRFTTPGLVTEKQNYPIYNDKVVGFVLENPANEEVNQLNKKLGTQDYAKKILNVYYNAERMLMDSIANDNRTMRINCGGVNTLSFNQSDVEQEQLIEAGEKAVSDFFPVDPRHFLTHQAGDLVKTRIQTK